MTRAVQEFNSFLTQEQEKELSKVRDLVNRFEFPKDSQGGFEAHLQSVAGDVYDLAIGVAFDNRKARRPAKTKAVSVMGLRPSLQSDALSFVRGDLIAAGMKQAVAVGTAHDTLLGDPNALEVGKDLAAELILWRARINASRILLAGLDIWSPLRHLGEEVSLWDRSIDIYDRMPKLKSPVHVSVSEAKRLSVITDKVVKGTDGPINIPEDIPILNSRFRIINAVRVARFMKKELRSNNVQGTNLPRLQAIMGIILQVLPIPELDTQEISDGVRTVRKLERGVLWASRIDPALAEDHRVHYLTYLLEKLGGLDVASELVTVNRDAQKLINLEATYKRLQK